MLILSERDVSELITTAEVIPLLDSALRGVRNHANIYHPRVRMRTENYVLHVLPAALAGPALGTKLYLSGGERTQFMYVLFDGSGVQALIAADVLGRLRTGAAAGLATRALAHPAASRLVVFGAGSQARPQIEAIHTVRPLTKLTIVNRNLERASRLASAVQADLGIRTEIDTDAQRALGDADIVSTVTSSQKPVFSGTMLGTSVHVNAVGSNRATHREIDETTLARAACIAVEDLEQAKREAGDLLLVPAFDWSRVRLLDAVLDRPKPEDAEITIFESLGIGLWDLALAVELVGRARASGSGTLLDMDGFFALPDKFA